jgi:hypothetical protein
MDRRVVFEGRRALCIAAASLLFFASAYSGADAQVNDEQNIHCVVQRPGNASGPIDIVIDFPRKTINGAPADGQFRKQKSGYLNAYGIFSSNFILDVESWMDDSGRSGVRSINYVTIDRIHSAIRATTVPFPHGRSISGNGDCEVVAERATAP